VSVRACARAHARARAHTHTHTHTQKHKISFTHKSYFDYLKQITLHRSL